MPRHTNPPKTAPKPQTQKPRVDANGKPAAKSGKK